MQKITISGLAVVISMMFCTVSVAEAEPIPSPYRQARDGVPIGEIVCAGDRMLMQSLSGMPACVFAGSVEVLERLGFILLSEVSRDDLSAKQPGASEKAGGTDSLDASKTGDRPFVTTWRTASPNESITIPVGSAAGAYAVDWGDGSTSASVTGDQSHAYEDAGTYTVAITGNFERIYLNGDLINAPKLQSIEQWGSIKWISMDSAFEGAHSMIYNADDVPDLSGVTDMSNMFAYASSFNSDISDWDVSKVRNMSCMFAGASSFDGDLSAWDVSNVRDMSCMFAAIQFSYFEFFSEYFVLALPTSFDGDLSAWDVSEVTDMSGMFAGATSFDGDLSAWDVSEVTNMRGMFARAPSFDGDISGWDVSKVRSMSCMFFGAPSFDGDISAWNVSKVRSMSCMFFGATSFNGDLSTWDVSSVNDMRRMFWNSRSFNSNLSDWDVSGVSNMYGAFSSASSFDGDISGWDVSKVADMTEMFYEASSFDGDLSAWDVSEVTDMSGMFAGATSFDGDLSAWDVSNVRNMAGMFNHATSFDGDLSAWDISGVTDMRGMFSGASSFSHNLGNWYVVLDGTSTNIGSGSGIIGNIAAQNRALDGQGPTYKIGTGADSALFAVDGTAIKIRPSEDYSGKTEYTVNITSTGGFSINNFRVINVTVTGTSDIRFEQAQADAAPFITTWRTASPNESITIPVGSAAGAYAVDWGDGSTSANVTGDQSHAYEDAGTYTVAITGNFERIYLNGDLINAPKLQSIEQWGGTKWISMDSAFEGAHGMIYNADDVPYLSGVTDMSGMFARASSFDGDISAWDVSRVTDMRGMFSGATSFDSDLSGWDISNVRHIARMFLGATSFDSDLSAWDVSGVTDMRGMFADASSFDGDISAWDVSGVTDMRGMHHGAKSFNGDLSAWDVSSVANMAGMFTRSSSFNGDLSGWDVSNVRNMASMFNHATSFDSDLSGWDVSSVTDMSRMFSGSILDEPTFNCDLSGWDVSRVTDMHGMFSGATSFDSDLSGWDVSSVTDMSHMFLGATAFDSDLSGWDVSSVRNMAGMFNHTTSFDSDLSGWDVSSVTDMDDMFSGASSFSQNLGNWYVVLDDTSTNIGSGSGIIGNIAAQNRALDGQGPTYKIGTGADSALFAVDGTAIKIRPSEDYSGKTEYTVNITSTGDFGTNNFRMVNIAATGSGSASPP